MGKYVNNSKTPNCCMKAVELNGRNHLCLFALCDLKPYMELRYSYGVSGLPWRKVKGANIPFCLNELKQSKQKTNKNSAPDSL